MAAGATYWGLEARRCDTCGGPSAVLYCRDDAAYMCAACDAHVHHGGRHARVWMCEVCEQAPAAVTCKADAATLCASCDADIHSANPLARRHERVPVAPFYDSLSKPHSAAAAGLLEDDNGSVASDWMIPNPNPKTMAEAPDLNFFAEADPYLDLDYGDGLVPVQGKPAAVPAAISRGAPTPPQPIVASDGVVEIDFTLGKQTFTSFNAHSISHSVSSSEAGVVPEGGAAAMTDVSNPFGRQPPAAAAAAMDREARVMRYREKRKNRKFEKTIRYASRKAYAETRPRIKGRFAKRAEMDSDPDPIYSSAAAAAAAILADNGYGIVPSF